MRVQRAPRTVEQPQQPPAGWSRSVARERKPAQSGSESISEEVFSADVDLDLSRLVGSYDPARLVGEIIVLLVRAGQAEGLIDGQSPLRLVRATDDGLVGQQLEQAVRQSGYTIGLALDALLVELPAASPSALTVVDLGTSRVRPAGGWGLGGVGLATLSRPVPTVVSHQLADGTGSGVAQRHLARLGLAGAQVDAAAVVRILNSVARAVDRLDR